MRNIQEARKRLIGSAILSAVTVSSATAKAPTDFNQLYKSKSYSQICKEFEADEAANWRNPGAAYFYSLGLLGLGKTQAAINVCRSIQRRYPKTETAKLARTAVELWSPTLALHSKAKPNAHVNYPLSEHLNEHIGIVGLKFVLGFGLPPTINRVFPSTPAYRAGLKDKDIITAVDGNPTEGLSKEEIFELIVGPPNTAVNLTIVRNGVKSEKQLKRMLLDDLKAIDPDVYRDYLMSI